MKKPKGEYIICVEEDETVYSTDSPFWRSFFTGQPLPGDVPLTKEQIGEKTDWSIKTHKGKRLEGFL